ncbi:uncharacterized protein METZ01_LOCUS461436, partial [marine metagenome]
MSTRTSKLTSSTIRTISQDLLNHSTGPIIRSSFGALWPTLRLVVLHRAVGVPPARRPRIVYSQPNPPLPKLTLIPHGLYKRPT